MGASRRERLGKVGGSQGGAVATEELHSNFRFQRSNSLAYGVAGNPKFESSTGKIAVPKTGGEHAQ